VTHHRSGAGGAVAPAPPPARDPPPQRAPRPSMQRQRRLRVCAALVFAVLLAAGGAAAQPAPRAVTVATAKQLEAAVAAGVPHIQIVEHLRLEGLVDCKSGRCGQLTMVLPASVKSIQVCDSSDSDDQGTPLRFNYFGSCCNEAQPLSSCCVRLPSCFVVRLPCHTISPHSMVALHTIQPIALAQ
jgi:hypothetical protein